MQDSPGRTRDGSEKILHRLTARERSHRQGRVSQKKRLLVESLEQRWLPSLTLQFANGVGATGSGSVDVESNAVTNDVTGNVFITGSLQGTANFNPGGTSANISSAGNRDIFLAKYAKSGLLTWAKDLRGGDASSVAQGAAISVDGSGNVIVSGTFTGTVNFDPGAGNTSFTASGRNDVFIAKYDPSGNLLWARDIVGTSGTIDEGYALAVDPSGNVAVAGSYQSAATFGSTTLNAGGMFEGFVAKLNPSGQFLWAKSTTGSGSSVTQTAGLTIDASGNVISAGFYSGTVNFDPNGGTSTPPSASSRAIFVQKLDASGNLVWAQGIAGSDINQANSVVADPSGNLYVTGTFTGQVNFDAGTGSTLLNAGGYEDPFLMKLSAAGKLAWAKDLSLTGFNFGQGTGVAVDGFGNVFAAGYFAGVMTLDPTAAGAKLTSAGGFDVFTAEYDGTGNFIAAQSGGGTGFDANFGIGVNSTGQVAIAGRYTGPATFGSVTLPAQPSKSIYVAQLNSFQPPAPPSAPSAPGLEAASDSGLSNSDRITNVTSPVFDVTTASAGNLVELLRDGVVVGSRTGPGAIGDAGPVAEGTHVYKARQTDIYGQAGTFSATTSVTIDTSPPASPSTPSLLPADDSGVLGDGITNVTQPHLIGTAPASTTAQLIDAGGNVLGSGTVDVNGAYSVAPTSVFADGTYNLRARAIDVAGNLGALSATFSLTIQTSHIGTPNAPALLPADDTGVKADGITSVKQPRLTGFVASGSSVQLLNPGGGLVATAPIGVGGAYTIGFSSALADGAYAVSIRVVDSAGNLSPASPTYALVIDTTPPATPSTPKILASDDSGVKGDGITNVKQPHFIGTADANTTIQLVNAANSVVGTGVAGANSAYSVIPTTSLADGSYAFTVEAVDAAGNVSGLSGSITLTIDATAPASPSTPSLLTSDDSGTKGDGITNIRLPHLIGTTAANASVQLLNAANAVIGTAIASPSGIYSITPASSLVDGAYTFTVQATDAAGNASPLSASFLLTIDTTAPASPSTPSLLSADDSGVKGDGNTNVTLPHLTGNAEANAVIQLLNGSALIIGTGVTNASGAYSIAPASALGDGSYSLTVQAIDAAGNASPPSSSFALTIATKSPAAPSAPSLLATDDSGVKGDGITNVNLPHLIGTALANTSVQLLNGAGTVIGSATSDASGNYAVVPAGAFGDGSYALTVRAVDNVGNLSLSSGSMSLIIDTTAPSTPTTPTLLATDDSGTIGDGITNVRQPHLTGNAAATSTVQIVNASGTVLGTATASSIGAYSVLIASPLTDGTYFLHARALDVAGNLSAASGVFTLSIATSGNPIASPTTPTLLAADDSGTKGDFITNINTPRMSGTGTLGTSVQIVIAGNITGTARVASDGSYTVAISPALPDGTYAVQAQTIDSLGNLSGLTSASSLTILTALPAAPAIPVLNPAADSGVKGDNITNVTLPWMNGNVAAGSTVQLLSGSGTVLGTAVASLDGSFTISPVAPLSEGVNTLTLRDVDVAGNVGPTSGPLTLTIKTASPSAPSAPILNALDDTGVKGDNITSVNLPRLSGTAVAGTTVQLVSAAGTVLGSTTAAADGSYVVIPSTQIPDGANVLTTRAIDVAGNASSFSTPLTLTLLSVPPAAPGVISLSPADDTGVKGDGITSMTQPRFNGNAPTNVTVQIVNASGTVLGTGNVGSDGTFTVAPSSSLPDGTITIAARLVDIAGNVSTSGLAVSVTIDTTSPLAPSTPILLPADDSGVSGDGITNVQRPRFTGTVEGNATVVLLNSSGLVLGSVQAGVDGKYTVQPSIPLGDGSYSVKARAIDVAGNLGGFSLTSPLTIQTAAPSAPAAPALLAADDTSVTGDSKTSVRRPRLTGTTLPGVSVDLLDASGTVLASTIASASSGAYTLQPSANLSVGAVTFRVRVRDTVGNTSPAGSSYTLSIVDATIGDYTGDGKTSLSVFRPATAQWIVTNTSTGSTFFQTYGAPDLTDIPVPGDYDGTGHAELAIYRVSTAQWFINSPAGARVVTFGVPNLTDIPVPGDYDGVGYTQLALFRPGTAQWTVLGPSGAHVIATFGATNLLDIPVPGDYDGLGRTEPAVFRPSTAQWFVLSPSGGRLMGTFGDTSLRDIPVPGDYDGIGRTELAVFRPRTAQWFVLSPTGGRFFASYGAGSLLDYPTVAPVGSLKKLGTAGGIRIASLSVTSAPRTGADLIAPADAMAPAPLVTVPVSIAKKRPHYHHHHHRADALLGAALESLLKDSLRRRLG